MNIRKSKFLIVFLLLLSNKHFAQDTLPPNNGIYFGELPPIPEIKELCSTPEGRKIYIQNMDSLKIQDLYFQWKGAILQKWPTDSTFDIYLEKYVNRLCEGQPGYLVDLDPNYRYFHYGNPKTGKFQECNYYTNGLNKNGPLNLPDGWQACKIQWTSLSSKDVEFEIIPHNFYQSDKGLFPRYRGYYLSMYAPKAKNKNDLKCFIVDGLTIFAIRDTFNNEMRKYCGCTMPEYKQSPRKLKPESVPPAVTTETGTAILSAYMVDINGNQVNQVNGQKTVLVLKNTGNKKGVIYLELEYYDVQESKWKLHRWGGFNLPANHTESEEFKINWSSKWRLRGVEAIN
jgi:hypothetical protein